MNRNTWTMTLAAVAAVAVMTQPAAAQTGRIVVRGTVVSNHDNAQYGPRNDGRWGYNRGDGMYDDRGDYRRGDYRRGEYAFSNGYRDGYDKGFDDARDGDRFDLRRHRRYRDGEHGYDRDYGMSRDRYRDIYRRGFSNGYEDGYRAARRGYGRDWRSPYRDRTSRGGFWFDFRF